MFSSSSAIVDLSPRAVWDQNGLTVAGSSNGTPGSSLSHLTEPIGIAVSNDDVLYIADAGNHRVVVIDLDATNSNVTTIGFGPGSKSDQFNRPSDLSIVNSSLYVVDQRNRRLQQMSVSNVNLTMTFNLAALPDRPFYLHIDTNGGIYISERDGHAVFFIRSNSTSVTRVAGTGESGSRDGQLDRPYGIFVSREGALYIADRYNHRIMKWLAGASTGSRVAGTGTTGKSVTQVNLPTDIVVDGNDYMYITESGNSRVTRWAPGSTSGVCIVACTGTSGISSTQLSAPHSLAFDRHGSLYVSDYGNHRVQKFQILSYPSECLCTEGSSLTEFTASSTIV